MTEDVESKVMKETGISGAVIGAAAGAAAGIVFGVAAEAARSRLAGQNFNVENAKRNALVLGVAGMAAGGQIGYSEGQKQGEKLVVKAMDRDSVETLLKGARAYNKGLQTYNTKLRSRIAAARNASDVATRRSGYKSLESEAKSQLDNANQRIAERKKAVGNQAWAASQRKDYKDTIGPLAAQRNSLQKQVDLLAKLRTEGVY